MDAIATQIFRFATPAAPGRVWAALTTGRHLFGLVASSEWRPGAGLVFSGGGRTITGDVLAVDEPRRLSFSLRAGDGQPDTYVTWEVVEVSGGSIVRLYVDEPGAPADDTETEAAWLDVISRLEAALAGRGAAERRL